MFKPSEYAVLIRGVAERLAKPRKLSVRERSSMGALLHAIVDDLVEADPPTGPVIPITPLEPIKEVEVDAHPA